MNRAGLINLLNGNPQDGVLLAAENYLHPAFSVTRSGTATRRNPSGLIETVAANTTRFDYDVNGTLLGLLVEESRTNELMGSNDFTAASAYWGRTRATITAGDADGALGSATASKMECDTSSVSGAFINQSVTATASSTVTLTLHGKAGNSNWVLLRMFDGTNAKGVWFNLSTGAVGSTNTSGAGFTLVGTNVETAANGMYRAELRVTISTTTTIQCQIYLTDADNSFTVTLGNFIYIEAAQFEDASSFATSYIPTTTATVTRSADDIACMDPATFGFNASEGTIYLNARTPVNSSGANNYAFSFSNNTANENIRLRLVDAGDILQWDVIDGGVSQAALNLGATTYNTDFKTAIAYADSDFAAVIGGGAAVTDAAGTLPTVDRAHIGSLAASSFWNGHILKLRYKPVRDPEAQLQSMTA